MRNRLLRCSVVDTKVVSTAVPLRYRPYKSIKPSYRCIHTTKHSYNITQHSNPLQYLLDRGLLSQTSNITALTQLLQAKQKPTIYLGIDPTAASLHIGHLLPLLLLRQLQQIGCKPILVVGGATATIGDPSGRNSERSALAHETIQHNVQCITPTLQQLFTFDSTQSNCAVILNNYNWYKNMSFLAFISDVGRHFKVHTMLQRDSVKQRMSSDNNDSMSFTEFSYQLLQAYDYLYLYQRQQCTVQIGGSDQWGNITAGIQLIHKLHSHDSDQHLAYGITVPLLTTANGEKFGKSAGNAVWLDKSLTSAFQLYQYFLSIGDENVYKYLLLFTDLSTDELQPFNKPSDNKAGLQKLAYCVTELIHGTDEANKAVTATNTLFSTINNQPYDLSALSYNDILSAFHGVPQYKLTSNEFIDQSIQQLCVSIHACTSKAEVRRLIASGGLYINNQRVTDDKRIMTQSDCTNNVCIVRTGKSKQHLVLIS